MIAAPDPAEIAAPRDPALYAPRRVLGPGFWAFIVFGIVCVAAGAAVTRFGPSWFPRKPAPIVAPAPSQASASAVGAFPTSPQAVTPSAPAQDAEIGRLEARIALLETGQQRTLDAAGAALAADSLAESAQTARPFADDLASLERVLPLSPDLRALGRLAQDGAPTRAGLAVEFGTLVSRAAVAAHDPGRNGDFLAKLRHALSSIVSIRQVGSTQGSSPDALLARAQRQLNEGDVESALAALDHLPVPAQTVLAPWRAAAERRVEIDRHIAAIRADALAGLVQVTRAPQARYAPPPVEILPIPIRAPSVISEDAP